MPLVNFSIDLKANKTKFNYCGTKNVVFEPEGPKENYGTEDPRVAFNS